MRGDFRLRAMGRTNKDWHLAHPMPPRATLDQRVAWHLEHARHCACRGIPAGILTELERRGLRPPGAVPSQDQTMPDRK